MRHPNGDKIVIKRGSDGHYVYFSVRQDKDNGSIIDFVQNRLRLSLGAVRKELRPWIGVQATPSPYPALPKTTKDRIAVEAEFTRMNDAHSHPYLEKERAIPSSLLKDVRFAGRVRIDARGNAVFPHFDQDGLCGYEIKNAGFTGFSRGGTKGLWQSKQEEADTRFVLCESAIDGLSHAVLFPDMHTRYASIGGQVNPLQPELIRVAIAALPAGAEVVSAMDADAEGGKLAGVVKCSFDLAARDDLRFTLQEPFGHKDWNDQLRAKRQNSFPTARASSPHLA